MEELIVEEKEEVIPENIIIIPNDSDDEPAIVIKRIDKKKSNTKISNTKNRDIKLQKGDIICLIVDGLNKFGEFDRYGQKDGTWWVNIRKKNSLEHLKRQWSVKDYECDIVYQGGVLNSKYLVDENGIYSMK